MISSIFKRSVAISSPVILTAALTTLVAALPVLSAHGQAGDGFVKWTEPKEKAFSQEVPQGWKVTGGLVRAGQTDVRQYIHVESPQKDAVVQIGDPSLPQFCTVGPLDAQLGYHEGQARNVLGNFTELYLHFMSATEFNRWYIQNGLSQVVESIQVGNEQDLAQVSQTLTAKAQQQAGSSGQRPVVSMGVTEFSGISKETGKPVKGAVMTMTRLMDANSGQYGSIWTALPVIAGGIADENDEQRTKKVIAILGHMMQSRRDNPTWSKKEQARVARVSQEAIARNKRETQIAIARIRDAGQRSRMIAQSSGAARQSSMSAYWQRNAARAENQHQFINYISDRHDVYNPDGSRQGTAGNSGD